MEIPGLLRLLRHLRSWFRHLCRGTQLAHVHRRPSHFRHGISRNVQRCIDNYFKRTPNPEAGSLYGLEYGYGPVGARGWANYGRRVYDECFVAVVYISEHFQGISAKLTVAGFYINLPLGVIVGGFILFNRIPEPKPKSPPLQVLGTAIRLDPRLQSESRQVQSRRPHRRRRSRR